MNEQIGNKINDKTYIPLTPFKGFVLENFPFIEADFDAITNYQLLCKVIEYLNNVISNQNTVQELGTDLVNAYNSLVDAVNSAINEFETSITGDFNDLKNYVDNLDFQDEVNNKLDQMVEDGTFDTIINDTLFTEINNNIEKLNQFVTIEEFKEESDVDDTSAFQLAIADGRPIYLLNNTYTVSETITINSETKIYGKSMNNSIINVSHNNFTFSYITDVHDSAYDIKTNIILDNFTVNCKNFIKINEYDLETANWKNQASLLHLEFTNLNINGTYDEITDNNKNTNVLPDLSTLFGYGCGFQLNSIFDSIIKNCRIQDFGLGVYLKGCDINNISNNRFNSNGCHIFLQRCDTYGSQNRIEHNDMLQNLRYGGIRIDTTKFDTIEDNYFECYTASACAIYGEHDDGVSIINNRFDNPNQSDIDLIRLSPGLTSNVAFNRVNPRTNSQRCYINVLNDNFGNFANLMSYNTANIIGNNGKLEQRNNTLIYNGSYNPLLISPYNINFENQRCTGTRFVHPYFILDTTDNLYYYLDTTSAGSSLILQFEKLKKYYGKYPMLRFTYKSSETTMYVQVKGDGNTLYNSNVNITNDGTMHYVDLDLTSNTNLYDVLRIELPVKAGVKLYSVELI